MSASDGDESADETSHAPFVTSSSAEILDALGASVSSVLSDMPWSFRVSAGSGETVAVWVSELPDTVTVDVRVEAASVTTFSSTHEAVSRLLVTANAPQIVVESDSGATVARLEISLTPRLMIRDALVRRPG